MVGVFSVSSNSARRIRSEWNALQTHGYQATRSLRADTPVRLS